MRARAKREPVSIGTLLRRIGGAMALFFILVPSLEARGQPVSLSDLEGSTIEADVVRAQLIERQSHTFSVTLRQHWRIIISPDGQIQLKFDSSARGPFGERVAPSSGGFFAVNQLREVRSRGGGQAIWLFAGNKLTFIRTFPSGALRMHFAVFRGRSGLSCSANGAFAREVGKGPIRLESPFGGGEIAILRSKQISSSCRLTKSS